MEPKQVPAELSRGEEARPTFGKDVRNNLPLSSMLSAVTSIEETTVYSDESIVEDGLDCSVAVTVNSVNSIRISDGQVVGRCSTKNQ